MHGGHLGADEDAAKGFDNWRKCVDGLDLPVPLLIENTAGGDNAMARRLEAIARLWDAIGRRPGRRQRRLLPRHVPRPRRRQRPRHASSTRCAPSPGASTSCTPTTRRDEFDSGADRHTNFGSGHIDGDALADVVRRPGRPSSCETPGGLEGQTADIAWLRERLG